MLVVIQYIVEYLHQDENGQAELQTELSLQQKSEVLLRIQKDESQRKLAEKYGVSKTTTAKIKKNEHSIINSVESNCSQNRKRKARKNENEEVINIMLEFFIKCMQEDSTSESDLVSALPEALQFEVASGKTTFWKTKQIFQCMKTLHSLLRAFWKTQ